METMINETKEMPTFLADVLEGLKKSQKTLPSKYFYDKKGSELFEAICELEEYYPTRTELSIMKQHIGEITHQLGENTQLIELGSGSSLKTRLLLDHLPDIHSYVPVDISNDFLSEATQSLQMEYPEISITPIAADYTKPFNLPEISDDVRRIFYYPGSTIGNFTKENAARFISLIAGLTKNNGGLLIGFDLLKDRQTLIDAYDDAKGITAEFNKNILVRINRELDANFNPDQFEHHAIFNERKNRIEMHLVSKTDQVVHILDSHISFKKGETIHTENSHKYSLESFKTLTHPHFNVINSWTDEKNYFCIQFLKKQ